MDLQLVCQGCFVQAATRGIYCDECHYDIAGSSATKAPSGCLQLARRNETLKPTQRLQMRWLGAAPDFPDPFEDSDLRPSSRKKRKTALDENDPESSWRRANMRAQPAKNSFFYRNIFTGKPLRCSDVDLWALTDGCAEVLTLVPSRKKCPFRMCGFVAGGCSGLSRHMQRRHGYGRCRSANCDVFFAHDAQRQEHEQRHQAASVLPSRSRCFGCERGFPRGRRCRSCRRSRTAALKAAKADNFFI